MAEEEGHPPPRKDGFRTSSADVVSADQPLGFHSKSFSSLLSSSGSRVNAAVSTYRGEPAVTFSMDDMERAAAPFQFALVGKFSRGRPSMEDLRKFKEWSKHGFGNIFVNARKAEKNVLMAERRVENDDSSDAQESLQRTTSEWNRWLLMEESFWKQKARVRWLDQGDKNTKFFHSIVKQRRAQSRIHRIKIGEGNWITSNEDIGREAVRYFSELFAAEPTDSWDVSSVIPKLLEPADIDVLERVPTIEEVRRVIFSTDGDSAPGPDGYSGKFFSFAWEIIAQDVYNAVASFFCGAELPRRVTATLIVLIPKVQNPNSFAQFRPISLCNFLNKVISRILAERLAPLLPRLVSPNQSGFVRGRQLSDNFLLAQEVLKGIERKNRGEMLH